MKSGPPRLRRQDHIVSGLAAALTYRWTHVVIPRSAVAGAFRLFGLQSTASQLALLWRMVAEPQPGMNRLRRRAARAVGDYRAILRLAPDVRGLMKLDFTILLGLYREALDLDLHDALDAGLVETYCHLAALVDAYDDLLDTPEARERPQRQDDFLTGETGMLRARLVAHLERQQQRRNMAGQLVAELASFERQALANHQALDLGGGLEAPLDAVIAARSATSGLLLRFAARLWGLLLALPPELATASEDAAANFGLIAQFADDVVDWSQDDGAAQNLLSAALLPYPDERAALRAARARRPAWSISHATLRRLVPRALADLSAARRCAARGNDDPRFAALRQFSDDVYDSLLPRLPAINFGELDGIRTAVQRALTA